VLRRLPLFLSCALLTGAAPAAAQTPIPEGPDAASLPRFVGEPWTPRPIVAPDPPRHPHMAPNSRSTLHVDAYQTDVHQGPGPLGRSTTRTDTFYAQDCASVTFDSKGRIVVVCVGLQPVTLKLLDPMTLAELASYSLPGRPPSANPFQNFTGGGYFYLDDKDRAVVPTSERHVVIVGQSAEPAFEKVADFDLTSVVPSGDAIISALPDWSGRIWFASRNGVVGTIAPATGVVKALDTKEPIGNSFAVDSDGSVSIVTDAALYRFEAGADGVPRAVWRKVYANDGTVKPGQTQAGSGTTPTLIGDDRVAITDNADPINVVVYKRGRRDTEPEVLCRQPVFEKGASSTDQSLIATPDFIVVENNYGYTGPASTQNGKSTQPGLTRIDLHPSGRGCRVAWTSQERAPTVVPKVSAAAGLVYTYTKEPREDGTDAWYLTALDVRTGTTAFKALSGEGLGHNNNYAPVTLGPDGTAYVGVLGGLVALRDAEPPKAAPLGVPARPRVTQRCRSRRLVVGVRGERVLRVELFRGQRRVGIDGRAPVAMRVRVPRRARLVAVVRQEGGTVRRLPFRARGCR
jgi:hypothetical protein